MKKIGYFSFLTLNVVLAAGAFGKGYWVVYALYICVCAYLIVKQVLYAID